MNAYKENNQPWYKNTYRWAQTNLTEIDARDCDTAAWKEFWRTNEIQGIVVNAGGIVAYYPSRNPNQYRSKFLGSRDLLREFCDAAKESGIVVLARMDINRATKEVYDEHPEWFASDKNGNPYRAGKRYIACLNSGYYKEYIPELMKEIINEYHPNGITDNSWWGASPKQICYCGECQKSFREYCGLDLPQKVDWDDRKYRLWIQWSVECRMKNWELFNEVTQKEGGEDCLWLGMVNANPMSDHGMFSDLQKIAERYGRCIMTDHQCREEIGGFEQNSMNGMLLHSLAGSESLIPESMANYNRGRYFIRRAANPPEETRTWMLEGIAGGLSPWTHFIGGVQEDRRMYKTCTPVMKWHKKAEKFLYNRRPVFRVGLAWSHENIRFYGKDRISDVCELPWRGFSSAMIKNRILFSPVNCSQIEQNMDQLDVLILPDVAVLTDSQIDQIIKYYKSGKSLVVTGATGELDELGYQRDRNPIMELMGIKKEGGVYDVRLQGGYTFHTIDNYELHNYMRLDKKSHEILKGFEDTDIVTISGQIYMAKSEGSLEPVATYIPEFPTYPPEISYMEDEKRATDIPVILAGKSPYGGRTVYIAADIDRRYGYARIPDHGMLLSSCVKWAAGSTGVFESEGEGYIDCKLYQQDNRQILQLVNLSGLNMWPGYAEEHYAVGPNTFQVHVGRQKVRRIFKMVDDGDIDFEQTGEWIEFKIEKLRTHEMIIIE